MVAPGVDVHQSSEGQLRSSLQVAVAVVVKTPSVVTGVTVVVVSLWRDLVAEVRIRDWGAIMVSGVPVEGMV
jgi:hypothetical protein